MSAIQLAVAQQSAPVSQRRPIPPFAALLARLGIDDDELASWAASLPADTTLAHAWAACPRPDALVLIACLAGVCGRKVLWALDRALGYVVAGAEWYPMQPYRLALGEAALGDYSRDGRALLEMAAVKWSSPVWSTPARRAVRNAAAGAHYAIVHGWPGDGPLPEESVAEVQTSVVEAVEAVGDDDAARRRVAAVLQRWLPWDVVDAALTRRSVAEGVS